MVGLALEGQATVNEEEFWGRLEYRVSREMSGNKDCQRLGLWCDGFVPEQYVLDSSPCYIAGQAWIGLGPGTHQEKWQFKLILRSSPASREGISWSELLPADEVTRWLTVDPEEKRFEIEPGASVPNTP